MSIGPQSIKFENRMQQIIFKQYDNLRLIEGVLYRTTKNKNGLNVIQFVLPKQRVQNVIKQIHTSVYHAHLGRRKTLSKITSKFYRPLIKEEIKNCIKECDSCQKIKGNIHKHNAELLHLAPSRPNQTNTITFVEGQINKRVKDKLNNRISPKNPRCKMKEIKRQLTIQNERINESNAPSRSQKDKTH